jgi:hypothetical protein
VVYTGALDDGGFLQYEATALVNTWTRQWFRTPGVRLLYLIPQSWTDQSIPLSIAPQPDQTLRVMLIRVEVITPEQEVSDVQALQAFDADSATAAAHFQALGRFAEPRLRRALALSPSAAGDSYLTQIQASKSSLVSGQ